MSPLPPTATAVTPRERLITQLYRDEGLRLHPYTDTTGHLTIGVGRNLTDRGISAREAEILLIHDLDEVEAALHRALPWVATLDPARAAVLVNMAFNLGVAGLLTFRRTLAAVQQGDFADAADQMLQSRWATQVGARATRLADQMRTGRWT